MSENKANIIVGVLDAAYEIIFNTLKNDLRTLYSCILVNRSFCLFFIEILWRNPFRFIKEDEKLIQIFNTLIHCLSTSDKKNLINKEFIKIEKLPTNKVTFKYHTFIKEFDLNPLQRGIRLWTSRNSLCSEDSTKILTRRSISRRVIKLNDYFGDLFFNKGNQYVSLNIYYNELLSGLKSLLDICKFKNHEKSLNKVNRLSLGFFHGNSTDLIIPITERILKLQVALSPNIQHLQILIDTFKEHAEFTENMINFIESQQNLKSLIVNIFWKKNEFTQHFLNALKKQSDSLTFFKLQNSTITVKLLLSMLNSLPKLITLELASVKYDDVTQEILNPSILFNKLEHNKLEHLSYDSEHTLTYPYSISSSSVSIFERNLYLSSNKLKSLKTKYPLNNLIDNYNNYQTSQLLPSNLTNLTHLHLIIDNFYSLRFFSNLHNLIHVKLEAASQLDCLMTDRSINSIEEFFREIPDSLKILELNYTLTDVHLGILFNETQLNLQCIKLYNYKHYKNTSLRRFIDYAERKECFKELCISRDAIQNIPEKYIREARNYFNVTMLADNEMDIPFYELPIHNSYWSRRINSKADRTVPKDRSGQNRINRVSRWW